MKKPKHFWVWHDSKEVEEWGELAPEWWYCRCGDRMKMGSIINGTYIPIPQQWVDWFVEDHAPCANRPYIIGKNRWGECPQHGFTNFHRLNDGFVCGQCYAETPWSKGALWYQEGILVAKFRGVVTHQ